MGERSGERGVGRENEEGRRGGGGRKEREDYCTVSVTMGLTQTLSHQLSRLRPKYTTTLAPNGKTYNGSVVWCSFKHSDGLICDPFWKGRRVKCQLCRLSWRHLDIHVHSHTLTFIPKETVQ